MATAAMEAPKVKETPSITLPSAELARIVKIVAGKSGTGNPPFAAIVLKRANDRVFADYQNAHRTAGIYANVPLPTVSNDLTGPLCTNDPQRLIDYIEGGIFAPDDQVTLVQADNTLRIRGGRRNATMSASEASAVPTQTFADPYGFAMNGCAVNTNPTSRPPDGSAWAEWTARGYAVYEMKKSVLTEMLRAGSVVFKRYKNTQFHIVGTENSVSATVQEAQDQSADLVTLGKFEDVTVVAGSPPLDINIRYDLVEPLWSILPLVKSDTVYMVHRPSSEVRINFLIAEDGGLVLTQYVARVTAE